MLVGATSNKCEFSALTRKKKKNTDVNNNMHMRVCQVYCWQK